LPFGAEFGLKLGNCAEHVEQQPACCVVRVNVLIQHLQMHLFPPQLVRNLTEM
jgi:hypothetical protein